MLSLETMHDIINMKNIPELKVLEKQQEAAWVWDPYDGRILWANISGLAFWDEPDLTQLSGRSFDRSMPGIQKILNFADQTLPASGITKAFTFWTSKGTHNVNCLCTTIKLTEEYKGLLLKTKKTENQNATTEPDDSTHLFSSNVNSHLSEMKHVPPLSAEDRETLQEIAKILRNPNELDEILSDSYFTQNTPSLPYTHFNDSGRTFSATDTFKTADTFSASPHEFDIQTAPQNLTSEQKKYAEFFAKISHEVRTPLNSILGFSELMKNELFGPIGNEKYKEYVQNIFVSAEHASHLINDLLDISKVQAGHFNLNSEKLNINSIVEKCVSLMEIQASDSRLIIRQSLSHTLPKVLFDERSLKQILLNLLSNAIKFTQKGEQIIISTLRCDDGSVKLRLRDTGVGMSKADILYVLQPFAQLDIAPNEKNNGSGLGLSLTKALVEANNSYFSISSEPGKGTLVEITFPKDIIE